MTFSAFGTLRAIAACCLCVAIAFASPATALSQDGPPKPVMDLKPGVFKYKIRMEIDGKVVPADLTHTIKAQAGAWVVFDTLKMINFTAVDSEVVERKTLLSRSRTYRDPTTSVDLSYAGRMVKGTVTNKGETRAVNLDMGGLPFANGPSGQDAVAALPLAQGYSSEFPNFSYVRQEVAQQQIRVLGSDTVTVPAGTFDTWKVLTISADGGSGDTAALWIDKKSRRVVKMASTLLGRNEMTATIELTK